MRSKGSTPMVSTLAVALATGFGMGAGGSDLAGQESRFSIEGRGGVTMPVGDLSDAGADAGFGIAGDLMYTFHPNLTAYGGLSFDDFGADGFEGNELSAFGFGGGLKVVFPRPGGATPWVRGGIVAEQVEIADSDSNRSPGLDAGVGIDLLIGNRVSLTPAARYRVYTADFGTNELDMSYFVIDLGGHIHF